MRCKPIHLRVARSRRLRRTTPPSRHCAHRVVQVVAIPRGENRKLCLRMILQHHLQPDQNETVCGDAVHEKEAKKGKEEAKVDDDPCGIFPSVVSTLVILLTSCKSLRIHPVVPSACRCDDRFHRGMLFGLLARTGGQLDCASSVRRCPSLHSIDIGCALGTGFHHARKNLARNDQRDPGGLIKLL